MVEQVCVTCHLQPLSLARYRKPKNDNALTQNRTIRDEQILLRRDQRARDFARIPHLNVLTYCPLSPLDTPTKNTYSSIPGHSDQHKTVIAFITRVGS